MAASTTTEETQIAPTSSLVSFGSAEAGTTAVSSWSTRGAEVPGAGASFAGSVNESVAPPATFGANPVPIGFPPQVADTFASPRWVPTIATFRRTVASSTGPGAGMGTETFVSPPRGSFARKKWATGRSYTSGVADSTEPYPRASRTSNRSTAMAGADASSHVVLTPAEAPSLK